MPTFKIETKEKINREYRKQSFKRYYKKAV